MLQNTDFYFNGEFSVSKDIFNANVGDSLYEQPIFGERTPTIEMIKNQPKGYLLNLARTPVKFSLKIGTNTDWTREKLDDIISWLDVTYFKEFYFVDQADRRFYVMPNGSPTFSHNGSGQGFIVVEMQSSSPFSFSERFTTGNYDLTVNPVDGTVIDFPNSGHFNLYPMMRITKIGAGTVSIKNETNLGKIFELRNLLDGEGIFINNETKEIISDIGGTYHYDDHNGVWLELLKGNNSLRIYGNCLIEFEYRFRYSPTL
jgi:phage-related protein